MKKILVLFLLSIYCTLPVFAGELQENFEKKYVSKMDTSILNLDNFYLIRSDFDTYKEDKNIECIYGYLTNKFKQTTGLDKRYYELVINYINDSIATKNSLLKIQISDNEYSQLSLETKEDLARYNTLIADNSVDITKYEDDKFNLDTKELDRLNNLPEPKLNKKEKFNSVMVGVRKWLTDSNEPSIYNDLLKNRKNALEQKKQKEMERLVKATNILYLRAFEERAYNTSYMSIDNDLTWDNGVIDGKTLLDKVKETDKQVESMYLSYKNNPIDIKRNYNLIKLMGTSKGAYTSAIKNINADFIDKAYKIYNESYDLQIERFNQNSGHKIIAYDILISKDSFLKKIANDSPTIQAYNLMVENIKKYDDYAKDVSEYSYNYEKNKYEDWCLKNNKKRLSGALEQFVYASHYQPQNGVLYQHNPSKNLFLKVLQSLPNGVLLTGSSNISIGMYDLNTIFLQTTKSFADGQIIREPIIAEFQGYYTYTTVLGTNKKVYKFYGLGQKEIENHFSIPNQPFYFYSPY